MSIARSKAVCVEPIAARAYRSPIAARPYEQWLSSEWEWCSIGIEDINPPLPEVA